jgi:hypothetical protein
MATLCILPQSQPRSGKRSDRALGSAVERCDSDGWQSPIDAGDDASDLEDPLSPLFDDDQWEIFLPDDEPYERRPEPGDFWIDAEEE